MIDCARGPNRMGARHLGTRIMTDFSEQIPRMYEHKYLHSCGVKLR
jgi:hypothetical protein